MASVILETMTTVPAHGAPRKPRWRSTLNAAACLGAAWAAHACGPVPENKPESLGDNAPYPVAPTEAVDGSSATSDAGLDSVCNGEPPIATTLDGGCAVSFADDVMPILVNPPGNCAESGACHGSAIKPILYKNDADATWQSMRTHVLGSQTYVDICSTDPEASKLLCNLKLGSPPECGSFMPRGSTTELPQAQLDTLRTWLSCGAPNN